MTDIALRILLQAQDTASKVISGFGSQLMKLSGDFKPLMIGAGLAGVAILGIGAISTKMAADFQQAVLSLVAHAGLAKSQVDNVTQSVLAMAPVVGRSPTELADALYPILSAFSGITNQSAKTQLALATLKLSFEAVAGTTTDGTAVANAAVGTFNALGLATNNAATNAARMTDLMDKMDLTVQLGNMRWDQYKNVISKLSVSIQGTGVSFNEASAALATMTNEGFSAQKSQTYLSNTFTTLAIKTDAMAKHAKALGISFNEPKYAAMNLADKIKYLNDITDGNKQKLLALMGGNSTALKTFNALSTGVNAYKSNLQALQHAHGALASSFDTASKGFNFAMSQAKAAIDALLIKIGTNLLPILTQIVSAVGPIITGFLNFTDAISKNGLAMDAIKSVLLGVAVVIAIVLVNAFIAWATAAWAAAVATVAATWPILLIGAIVAVVVFGIIQAVKHWGAIVTWLGNVWHTVSTAIGGAFSWLGTMAHTIIFGIISWFQHLSGGFKALLAVALVVFFPIVALILGVILVVTHWGAIMKWFGGVFSAIGTFIHSIISKIGDAFSGLGSTIKGVWDGIVGAIKGAINFIIGIINAFIGGIDNIQVNVGPVHVGFAIPKIPYLASGGYVESTGLAMIHRGEHVVPARTSPIGAGGAGVGGQTVNMYVTINGPSRQMADDFIKEVSRRLKQQGVLVSWTSGGRAV
jgi:TP901 family phage tail tape measure protein